MLGDQKAGGEAPVDEAVDVRVEHKCGTAIAELERFFRCLEREHVMIDAGEGQCRILRAHAGDDAGEGFPGGEETRGRMFSFIRPTMTAPRMLRARRMRLRRGPSSAGSCSQNSSSEVAELRGAPAAAFDVDRDGGVVREGARIEVGVDQGEGGLMAGRAAGAQLHHQVRDGRVFAIAEALRDLADARTGGRGNLRVLRKASETVFLDTPARRAMSAMVGLSARIYITVK